MRYRAFDLSGVDGADRLTALQAQLAAWQALPEPAYLVSWQGAFAQVFAVPKACLDDAGVRNPQWLPETLAREPLADGVRLLAGLDGFEAQAWQGGVLRTSRWWAEAPSADAWSLFQRQAGRDVDAAGVQPQAAQVAWIRPKHLPTSADSLEPMGRGSEQRLAACLALVLVGMAVMSGRLLWDSFDVHRRAEADLAALRADVEPVVAARDKALAAADQVSALVAQLRAPSPLEVLEELIPVLPKSSLVRELDLQGMEVRVLADWPADVARSKVISDLEAGGWFVQVAEARDSQPRAGVTLQMKLSADVPPQRGNADTGLRRLASEGLPGSAASAPVPGSVR